MSTTYCMLSGCYPAACGLLQEGYDDRLIYVTPLPGDPPLRHATAKLCNDGDEANRQDDLTLIGWVKDDGSPWFERDPPDDLTLEDALSQASTNLHVIPHCHALDSGASGYITAPDPNLNNVSYLVSHGVNIMCQTAAVPILSLATDGCMTLERLWKVAMKQGHFANNRGSYTINGIDYGEIKDGIYRIPLATPGIPDLEDAMQLNELGEVDKIVDELVWRGKFWVWMTPDRFPIESPEVEGEDEVPPVHSEAAAAGHRSLSSIENVPLEIFFQIAFHLELPSLLRFATTSRSIRRSLLGDRSARNAVGKALIERHLPHLLPAPLGEAKPSAPAGAWSYLRRCLKSPSMRNRRRIWAIAQRLEMMADRLGL